MMRRNSKVTLTALQQASADHIFSVFTDENSPRKRYLLADEVGLGKTKIAADVISRLAARKGLDKPFIVYYICGNERVSRQNTTKLIEDCNGIETMDVRLSMQVSKLVARIGWKRKNQKKSVPDLIKDTYGAGVVILPVTPATTFTDKNSEHNEKEEASQNALLKRLGGDWAIPEKQTSCLQACGVKLEAPLSDFLRSRKFITATTIVQWLKPDMVLLDEFQNYEGLLYDNYPLFQLCLRETTYVLMLSATPYEMNNAEVRRMNAVPFDDGLGIERNSKENNEVEDDTEHVERADKDSTAPVPGNILPNFRRLAEFIYGGTLAGEKLTDEEFLYNNIFCRSERSMFYAINKDAEVNTMYAAEADLERHMNYISGLYRHYKKNAPRVNNIGLNKFIAFSKEAPSLAKFTTRYSLLKKGETDSAYFKRAQDALAPEESLGLNPFDQLGMGMVAKHACPDGIETMLWIPPILFSPPKQFQNDSNPFWKNRDYTKTLIFGNYRLSTAAPAYYFSDKIRSEQADLTAPVSPIPSENHMWEHCPEGPAEYAAAVNALNDLFRTYLDCNTDLIKQITGIPDADAAKATYAAMGDLRHVVDEYAYLLGLKPGADSAKLQSITKQLKEMSEYFIKEVKDGKKGKYGPTGVIFYDSQKIPASHPTSAATDEENEEGDAEKDFKRKHRFPCGFAERFTDDNIDANAHRKAHQAILQHLFNSPLYPFVMASTAVAQEGLDFHNYCHRLVHWSVPRTPVAYEQREGRIDRFLSHLARKRILITAGDDTIGSMADLIHAVKEKQGILEEKKGCPAPLYPYWYIGKDECEALHNKTPDAWPQMQRIICALPQSAEAEYYRKLRAALEKYNYHLGPTYQEENDQSLNMCPLLRKKEHASTQ